VAEECKMAVPAKDVLNLRINVIVERQANNTYLAHCLELDLLAEGNTPEEACNDLMDVIFVHVLTCIENDNLENLYFPAPKEVWEKFGLVRAKSTPCTVETRKSSIPDHPKFPRTVKVDQYCYA